MKKIILLFALVSITAQAQHEELLKSLDITISVREDSIIDNWLLLDVIFRNISDTSLILFSTNSQHSLCYSPSDYLSYSTGNRLRLYMGDSLELFAKDFLITTLPRQKVTKEELVAEINGVVIEVQESMKVLESEDTLMVAINIDLYQYYLSRGHYYFELFYTQGTLLENLIGSNELKEFSSKYKARVYKGISYSNRIEFYQSEDNVLKKYYGRPRR